MKRKRFFTCCPRMGRRDFGKAALLGAAALPINRALAGLPASGPQSRVSLADVPRGSNAETIARAVREAALAVTDFSWLSRGDTVLIKPVLNSGNPYPSTTSPDGLKAMVELLREKGAGKVLVCDMSGIEHVKLTPDNLKGSSRGLARNAGLLAAAEASGAEPYFPEEEGWEAFSEEVPEKGGSWKSVIMMPRILKEVDHIVLMPRCGRHVLAGSTLGLKAGVGWWRTDSRLEYHRDASTFHEKTAEANTVPSLLEKQRLVLTVADKVLTTFGPDDGYVVEPETGLVYASTSVVAHDMVSLAWLIENRKLAPDSEIGMIKDPNTSEFMVHNGNRLVVGWLGGVREAARAEKLLRYDLNAIWDDRVLGRAFEIFGGVPRLDLVDPEGTVPLKVKEKISAMTSRD